MRRVVLDTNVWVSAALSSLGTPARIIAAFLLGRFTVVISDPLLAELRDVLTRPRIAARHGWSQAETADFVAAIASGAEWVDVTGTLHLCRDPKDDVVVETALAGRAEVLVSGDEDFKGSPGVVAALTAVGARILTPSEFLAELGDETG